MAACLFMFLSSFFFKLRLDLVLQPLSLSLCQNILTVGIFLFHVFLVSAATIQVLPCQIVSLSKFHCFPLFTPDSDYGWSPMGFFFAVRVACIRLIQVETELKLWSLELWCEIYICAHQYRYYSIYRIPRDQVTGFVISIPAVAVQPFWLAGVWSN